MIQRTTTMQSAKQEALETIGKLPDDTDVNEIIYRLYVLVEIRKGQEDEAWNPGTANIGHSKRSR